MRVHRPRRLIVPILWTLVCLPRGSPAGQPEPAETVRVTPAPPALQFRVEWRLMRAGTARLAWKPPASGQSAWQADLHLASSGLVARLVKVDNAYTVAYDDGFCASTSIMKASEGKRRREVLVTYNQTPGKASYLERDLVRNAVSGTREIDVPGCVHDVVAALEKLRTLRLDAGESIRLPMSDGRKSALVQVRADGKETVSTPAGVFRATRYEAFLFNDVLYRRKGRLFVWLTDDDRRLPVQIRMKFQFYLGSVTLQLEKESAPAGLALRNQP